MAGTHTKRTPLTEVAALVTADRATGNVHRPDVNPAGIAVADAAGLGDRMIAGLRSIPELPGKSDLNPWHGVTVRFDAFAAGQTGASGAVRQPIANWAAEAAMVRAAFRAGAGRTIVSRIGEGLPTGPQRDQF
jgi:hypothetical protein